MSEVCADGSMAWMTPTGSRRAPGIARVDLGADFVFLTPRRSSMEMRLRRGCDKNSCVGEQAGQDGVDRHG